MKAARESAASSVPPTTWVSRQDFAANPLHAGGKGLDLDHVKIVRLMAGMPWVAHVIQHGRIRRIRAVPGLQLWAARSRNHLGR